MVCSGAWGKLILKNNLKSKISSHSLLVILLAQDVVVSAMRVVRDPGNQTRSLYDFLVEYNKGEDKPVKKVLYVENCS
jgi:hypothetical protein